MSIIFNIYPKIFKNQINAPKNKNIKIWRIIIKINGENYNNILDNENKRINKIFINEINNLINKENKNKNWK
jgi:hypothetical protein